MRKNGVLYFGIPSFIPEMFKFVNKLMKSQTLQMTVINPKMIENISENIGRVLFKLGTSNIHQIRPKVTPLRCCHGNTLVSSPSLKLIIHFI